MAPAANLLVTALALAASADAFPTPNLEPFKTFLKRYYGDSNGLTRPPPLMDKRGLLPSGWSYAGCGTESHFQRLLQGFSFRSKVNTPTMCMNECAKRGFTIAGTEFADECYCGNAFTGSGGIVVPDSFCAMPCAGDHGEKCGSAWYLSLYTYNVTAGELYCSSGTKTATVETPKATPTTTTTTQTTKSPATTPTTTTATSQPTTTAVHRWSPLGCALDNVNGVRVLSGFNQLNVPDMTPEACQKTCAAKGFSYAGVEDGDECWCGSSLAGTVKWDSSLCQKPCAGNSGTTCGGLWALQVYELSNSAGSVTKTPAVPTTILTATPHPDTTTTNNAPPTMTTRSIPQSQEQHYVWAHYMVGNTFTYFQSDWADDIAKAKAQGIDGFALNVGSEFWEPNRVQAAYRAAEAAGDFKLFLSLDMTSLGCGSTPDANGLVSLVQSVASSPAQARINGKVLVSTFAGEQCTFGTGSVTAWKTLFKDRLAGAGLPVDFMPAFFVDPTSFASYDWIDGHMSWNGAWPMGDYSIETNSLDAKYVSAVGSSKAYMTTVSPFFFTHFGKATWNKNWIYRSDDWLYCTRWEQIIATRDKSIMTEIVTWNDYGESTYIGPIKGMLPITSNSWVDGFPHTGLATLTSYYATAFKTGAYPAITKDTITMWSRPHPASANALVDIVGRPTNWQWTDDNLYAVVLATAPATVTLYSGSTSQTFNVPAGLSKLKIPSAVGGIGGTITRGGATVASYSSGSDFQYTLHPMSYNYNYFVGSSA